MQPGLKLEQLFSEANVGGASSQVIALQMEDPDESIHGPSVPLKLLQPIVVLNYEQESYLEEQP